MATAKKKRRARILGIGLDSDGHKRVTSGENFTLVGGTEETHDNMTERVIKLNEKLKSRGKHLETVSTQEFEDIAHEVGLKKISPQ
jgi:seryl-tRNA(Sec) selenium transferase